MENETYSSEVIAERRRFPRKPLNLRVHFKVTSDQENATSKSENISATGLAFTTEKNMLKGHIIELVIFLPPYKKRDANIVLNTFSEEECIPVKIQAQIEWRLPFIGKSKMYGVTFLNVDTKDQPELNKFLQDFYIHKPNIIQK